MSHPIRPDEVIEMNNFYTVTVYDKGAEVIRMLHTLLGAEHFRQGMDLYFKRFDGQAVTCDDFVQALEDASGKDLTRFRRWYSQSGTPTIRVEDHFDEGSSTYSLSLSQLTKATADQSKKQALHIPLRFSLLEPSGEHLILNSAGESEIITELTEDTLQLTFAGVNAKPVPSLLHNFSAPVRLHYLYTNEQLAHIVQYSPDDFARWDASQKLYSDNIHKLAALDQAPQLTDIAELLAALKPIVSNVSLSAALKAEMLTLPSFETLSQQVETLDIDRLYQARKFVLSAVAFAFVESWQTMYQPMTGSVYQYEPSQVERRKLNNLSLKYLQIARHPGISELIIKQFELANNMTDSLSALAAAQLGELDTFDQLMQKFEQKWQHEPLVLDKWFALHANTPRSDILARLDMLAGHAQYSISNPNRVRSLVGSFAFYNVPGFHAQDGSGYAYLANYLIKLNNINPQVAARLITPLTHWQKFDKSRQDLMQHQLLRISDTPDLSKDLFEKITKSLNFKH